MICPKCGSECGDAKFCVSCGAKVEAPAYQPVPSAEEFRQQQSGGYTAPNAAYAPQGQPIMAQPDAGVLGVGDFMVMRLLLLIPIVGLVMLFVWGFGSDTNLNKRNWARAELIWALIGVVFTIVIVVLMVAVGASVFANMDSIMGSMN